MCCRGLFFFFQAEDGIRDLIVTGVQTCALPISLMEGLSSEYQRERERWVRGAEALRRETIGAILAEQAVDTDAAGRVLGYDLRRHHIGLVLWAVPTPDDPHVIPRLERAATAASAHLE